MERQTRRMSPRRGPRHQWWPPIVLENYAIHLENVRRKRPQRVGQRREARAA